MTRLPDVRTFGELRAWHALRASELLERVERQEEELARIEENDPDQHLQLVAQGLLGRLSKNREWSTSLAASHALAALALTLAGQDELESLDPRSQEPI
jgi:hypothetical protein